MCFEEAGYIRAAEAEAVISFNGGFKDEFILSTSGPFKITIQNVKYISICICMYNLINDLFPN